MGAENLDSTPQETDPSPTAFTSLIDYLNAIYAARQAQDRSYSYSQMAVDFGFEPSSIMSQYLSGRRKLTHKAAVSIAAHLTLNKSECRYVQALIEFECCTDLVQKSVLFDKLLRLKWRGRRFNQSQKDIMSYFGEWYHVAIKELLAIPSVSQDPERLAEILQPRIRVDQVRKSIRLLERLGTILWDESASRFLVVEQQSTSGFAPADYHLIRFHQEMAQLAASAVVDFGREERDITSATVRITDQQLKNLKLKIYDFLTQTLSEEASAENANRVYQLNVQLFPLTKKF